MKYIVTIGLEVHVQVRTRTKMFCSCPNAYGSAPNTNVCPVCLGYPGVLPTPNDEAIRKTLLAGMMCRCDLPSRSKFDRKAYWYPDMPKNYQITQFDLPFCNGGLIPIEGKGLSGEVEARDVKLTRIHLEEDVAKSNHEAEYSGIDFNRAGVPLMELVSDPDMHTPDEAYLYLQSLKEIMQYADISDCDMEKGQMRCDVNISVRPVGQDALNPKTEVKNVNSTRTVHRSLEYETQRQIDAIEDGEELLQQTVSWDEELGQTYVTRVKEDSHDYRYFPDPDLMPIETSQERFDEIRAEMPETPTHRRHRFVSDFGIPAYDAQVLCADKGIADFYEEAVNTGADAKKASNWIMGDLLGALSDSNESIAECRIKPTQLGELVKLIDSKTITIKIGKIVFAEMMQTGKDPDVIVDEKGLKPITDASSVNEFIQKAIDENPKAVEEFKSGKENALNFLLGQVMRHSKGKADPNQAREALREALT